MLFKERENFDFILSTIESVTLKYETEQNSIIILLIPYRLIRLKELLHKCLKTAMKFRIPLFGKIKKKKHHHALFLSSKVISNYNNKKNNNKTHQSLLFFFFFFEWK